MLFTKGFTRTVAAATPWTQDVLPILDAAGNFAPPNVPPPFANASLADFFFSAPSANEIGSPTRSIAVSYVGPAGAPDLTGTLYAWDAFSSQYLIVPAGSGVAIKRGQINLFTALDVVNPRLTNANAGRLAGATSYALIVANTGATTNGTYAFNFAAITSS